MGHRGPVRARHHRVCLALLVGVTAALTSPSCGEPVRVGGHLVLDEATVHVPLVPGVTLPVVEARIGGRGPYRLLVDTGAETTVLHAPLAAELGHRPPSVDSRVVGLHGAEGGVAPSLGPFLLHEVRLAGVELRSVIAFATDLSEMRRRVRIDGILGNEALLGCLVTVDQPEQRITLADGSLPEPDGRDVLALVETDDLVPIVTIEVAGRPVDVLLDSGNDGPLDLSGAMLDELVLAQGLVAGPMATTIARVVRSWVGRLAGTVQVGRHVFNDPLVRVTEGQARIGMEWLRRFAVTVDWTNRRVRLSGPRPDPMDDRSLGFGIVGEAGRVVVSDVVPAMPADALGLREGDTVVSVGALAADRLLAGQRAVLRAPRQERVDVRVQRDGNERILAVPLSELVPRADSGAAASHDRVVAAAARGGLASAAVLIERALWDEMARIDPFEPSVAAWREGLRGIRGLMAPQIYGDVLANWAVRQDAEDLDRPLGEIMREARELITSAPVEHPMLQRELAWLLRSYEPRDAQAAAALDARALDALRPIALATCGGTTGEFARRAVHALAAVDVLEDTGGDPAEIAELCGRAAAAWALAGDQRREADAWSRRGRWLRPDRHPEGSWDAAIACFARAAALYAAAGEPVERGRALRHQADCLDPDDNPDGSWARAAPLYARAARLAERGGDASGRALSLHQLAFSRTPSRHPDGSWWEVIALYEQVAVLRGELEAFSSQGQTLFNLGWCQRPDKNPAGLWRLAADAFGRSAEAYARADDPGEQSDSLVQQGRALMPSRNPEGSWARAAEAFARAAELRRTRDDRDTAYAVRMQAWCLEPDRHPEGSWTEAAALYAEAARLAAAAGDHGDAGWALVQRGRCLEPLRAVGGSWDDAVEAYAAAARAYDQADDDAARADALRHLARSSRPERSAGGSWERAASVYAEAADLLAGLDRHGEAADLLEELALCVHPERNPASSWSRLASVREETAELRWRARHEAGEARARLALARAVRPDRDPAGSWTAAEAACARAAELFAAAGDVRGEAAALREQAACSESPAARRERTASLYARSAARFAEAGDVRAELDVLEDQAAAVGADDPAASWSELAAIHARIAARAAEIGDRSRQGRALEEQARALGRGSLVPLNAETRRLLEEAALCFAAARDSEAEARIGALLEP